MTFRETLDRHLQAIRNRDLSGLVETLPPDELVLITSDGRLVRAVSEFIAMHRGWFAESSWTLDVRDRQSHRIARDGRRGDPSRLPG